MPPGIKAGDAFTVKLPTAEVEDEEQTIRVLPISLPAGSSHATVFCPPGKSEGNVISFHPGGRGRTLQVTIPSGAVPGSSFVVLVQGEDETTHGYSRRTLRALLVCVPTYNVAITIIWLVVSLNYTTLVLIRQESNGIGWGDIGLMCGVGIGGM